MELGRTSAMVLSGDLFFFILARFQLVPDKKLKNLNLWIHKPHEHQLACVSGEDTHQNTRTIMELEQKTSRWLSCLAVSTIWFIITFKWINKSKKTMMDGELSQIYMTWVSHKKHSPPPSHSKPLSFVQHQIQNHLNCPKIIETNRSWI